MSEEAKYYVTIGLHDGGFEMEILVGSAETKVEAERIAKSSKFHIGYLYDDKLVIKGNVLTIKKEQTDRYQFRVCREWKPVVSHEDYEDITWAEAVEYLIEEENRALPFSLESYYYGIHPEPPFML
ncbi:hypothetical protein [Shouchella clausii]|jgi:hypothetical protein|uniref:Uncharacterized protein n=1 Tax=Shouchella clausii TaxID=79880 RepID=A0A268NW15_SHOCL|nr:hypothetical protein [Shouchella clausii]PAE87713.1 hypothetical protein CHH72_16890 [Shouchella clausii]